MVFKFWMAFIGFIICYFHSFQTTKLYFFQLMSMTNKPSSIQCWDSNSSHLENESPSITTGPEHVAIAPISSSLIILDCFEQEMLKSRDQLVPTVVQWIDLSWVRISSTQSTLFPIIIYCTIFFSVLRIRREQTKRPGLAHIFRNVLNFYKANTTYLGSWRDTRTRCH